MLVLITSSIYFWSLAGPLIDKYNDTQIDLWRVTHLADIPQLHATHVSSLKIDLCGSHHVSLHGSILLQTRLGLREPSHACIELLDLAQSTNDLIIGARFVPHWPSSPLSFTFSVSSLLSQTPAFLLSLLLRLNRSC